MSLLGFESFFGGRGSQLKVAEYLLKNGIGVSGAGMLLASRLEVTQVSVAREVHVDRRVVKATIKTILGNDNLKKIFSNLSVTPSLRELAPVLGYGAIEIIPQNASGLGIVSHVSKVIYEQKMGIRQMIVDDPMFENAQMTIVTEKPIPRSLIDKILKIEGVHKVVVLN